MLNRMILFLLMSACFSLAEASEPKMIISCSGEENIEIDIYAAGHPMAGALRYRGVMQISETIVFVKTKMGQGIYFYGKEFQTTNEISYRLNFYGNPFLEPETIFNSQLIKVIKSPNGPSKKVKQNITCSRLK